MGKKKSKGLELADMMPRRVHVGPGSLRAIKTDLEFMRLVVELAKETGVLITLVANAALELENHPSSWPWPRNRAILGGLLVRLSKLYSALVEAVCKRKAELSRVWTRLIFETAVNFLYLRQAQPSSFENFVRFSLRTEKALMDLISKNLKDRGGIVLPIEDRMLKSIESSFSRSGVDPASVDGDDHSTQWDGKSIYKKAGEVGLGPTYLGFFSLSSHAVHGNWQDLLGYHLQEVEGGFEPASDWNDPDPRHLDSVSLIGIWAARRHVEDEFGEHGREFIARLDDLEERLRLFMAHHEKHLAQKNL